MLDPELASIVDFLPDLGLDDVERARQSLADLIGSLQVEIPGADRLEIKDHMVPGWEGDPRVMVRVFRPTQVATPMPGVLLIHGGGFVVGSVETEHANGAMLALATDALVVSVEYRLAPEHPYPAGLHDCYSALRWLAEHAGELGVDPERIALNGASAGGGLGAATALLARDLGGPALCFQMLHIPELDDRLETPSMTTFTDTPLWKRPLAVKSWEYYLGDLHGDDVPYLAAPARCEDLSGLPPTYLSTAENDPLRDEGILYALRLLQAGISVELHQFPGTFHGSMVVASAAISKRASREATVALRRALGVD